MQNYISKLEKNHFKTTKEFLDGFTNVLLQDFFGIPMYNRSQQRKVVKQKRVIFELLMQYYKADIYSSTFLNEEIKSNTIPTLADAIYLQFYIIYWQDNEHYLYTEVNKLKRYINCWKIYCCWKFWKSRVFKVMKIPVKSVQELCYSYISARRVLEDLDQYINK